MGKRLELLLLESSGSGMGSMLKTLEHVRKLKEDKMYSLSELFSIFWPTEDNKYITKCELGIVFYERPKPIRTESYKKIQLERQLCTAAYR